MFSDEGPRRFPREDNEIAKKYVPRTTGPSSTKHGKKHSWVKVFQIVQTKAHECPFPIGNDNEIAKIHALTTFQKMFSQEPLGLFQANKVSLDEEDANKDHSFLEKEIMILLI